MDTSRYFWNVPESAQSGTVEIDPSGWEPVRVGFVGLGVMGTASLRRFLELPTRVVAICDVDTVRRDDAIDVARDARPAEASPGGFTDFREMIAAADLEAVVVSTPDHWHVDVAVAALEAGLDVYVEKPLSLTIAGGRRLVNTANRTGRIVQTGSQQRSSAEFRVACELVRNGRLGTLESVYVSLPPNNVDAPVIDESFPVPDTFDHNLWLGPAPYREYHPSLCHYNFRFISDYSGGQMTNWGAHHLDTVQWALDADSSGPVEVRGTGEFHPTGPFDTAIAVDIVYRYAGGLPVYCKTEAGPSGVEFRGSRGVVRVGRGRLEAEPEGLLDWTPGPKDVRLYRSDNHYLDFLESMRTRTQPVAPAEAGHRSATVCHLGNIAIKLDRTLNWDPAGEFFVDDDEANSLRDRSPRSSW